MLHLGCGRQTSSRKGGGAVCLCLNESRMRSLCMILQSHGLLEADEFPTFSERAPRHDDGWFFRLSCVQRAAIDWQSPGPKPEGG
ncbi:MAG: hypothetical protein JWM99_697 [Verrucomicrobiales bacterium]|nr:hypothetical protein [Verrucomicrobiales bacterium]